MCTNSTRSPGIQNTLGTATITINSVTFGAPGRGQRPRHDRPSPSRRPAPPGPISPAQIDLRTKAGPLATDNLAFVSFILAKMPLGRRQRHRVQRVERLRGDTRGFRHPVPSGRTAGRCRRGGLYRTTPATGIYSYTFPTSAVRVSDGYVDNVVMRAGVQFSIGAPVSSTSGNISSENIVNSPVLDLFSPNLKLQNTSDRRPVANAILDVFNPVGGGLGTALPRRLPHQERRHHRGVQQVPRRAGDPRRRPPRDPVLPGLPQPQAGADRKCRVRRLVELQPAQPGSQDPLRARHVGFDDEDFSEVAYPQACPELPDVPQGDERLLEDPPDPVRVRLLPHERQLRDRRRPQSPEPRPGE